MVKIRLARVGKRGHATFRIVATEHTRPPKSGALAFLGSYDPHTNTVRVDGEKVQAYLARGAQLSPTVQNLLIEHKLLPGEKVRAWKPKKTKREAASPAPASHTAEGTAPPAGEAAQPQGEPTKPEQT